MASEPAKGLLARHGASLIRNGYQIVPIMRGEKFPPFNGWEQARADEKLLAAWLSGNYPAKRGPKGQERDFIYKGGPFDGVGILSAETPGVDLDIKDAAVAQEMQEFVELLIGEAPVRVGDAPKRLLLTRTDESFRKVQSAFWISPDGKKHKVEILGDGQQFVAIHIHPDTKQPYRWLDGKNPTTVHVSDLPILSEDAARTIVAEFERIAAKKGWTKKAGVTSLTRTGGKAAEEGEVDHDDPFLEDSDKPTLTEEELHRKLLLVPNAEDHDVWFHVGMALYHHFDGGERGLELWHEWSMWAPNYDADELEKRWPTFDVEGKGRQPITARFILKLANEAQRVLQTETLVDIEDRLKTCEARPALLTICSEIKKLELDQLTRETLLGLVQKRFKAITGQPLRLAVARDMIRFENPEAKSLPKWLEGWVYCTKPETFYNNERHEELSTQAFNAVYGRFMLTKKDILEGRSTPEQIATHVALHLHQIEIVENRMYMPNDDKIFWVNGRKYVNSYNDRNVPDAPAKIASRDKANVERVVAHAEHLFPIERDRNLFLDFIAHIVQGGQRPDWAILMQGTEQDGKTFWARVLSAILGYDNVRNLQAQALDEKYTPWAEGSQVNFFEEIRLHGHNRFDVLNKLKPLITNQVVDVRRMNVDRYQALNTAAYMLTTNYRDALPLDKNDSRYFILISRFQSQDALNEFKANNPHYYQMLHDALDESAPAIRRWFLDRVPSKEFNHTGRAPWSAGRNEMVSYAMSEEQMALEEIINESVTMDVSSALLDSTKLAELMHDRDVEAPYGRAMTRLLIDAGFTRLKKVRVTPDHVGLFWSRTPDRFRDPRNPSEYHERKIKAWLNPGL